MTSRLHGLTRLFLGGVSGSRGAVSPQFLYPAQEVAWLRDLVLAPVRLAPNQRLLVLMPSGSLCTGIRYRPGQSAEEDAWINAAGDVMRGDEVANALWAVITIPD